MWVKTKAREEWCLEGRRRNRAGWLLSEYIKVIIKPEEE